MLTGFFFPPPLRGRVRVGGRLTPPEAKPPLPNPPPQGGREKGTRRC